MIQILKDFVVQERLAFSDQEDELVEYGKEYILGQLENLIQFMETGEFDARK